MQVTYQYLLFAALLGLLSWLPYITARLVVWGLPTFLNNYPAGFPVTQPPQPLWAARAQRAHLNTLETLVPFIGVVLAASQIAPVEALPTIALWAKVFFVARLLYSAVYTMGVPYLRTPVYLVSWFAILMMAKVTIF